MPGSLLYCIVQYARWTAVLYCNSLAGVQCSVQFPMWGSVLYKLAGRSCRCGSHGRLSLTQCAGCRHGLPVQSAGRWYSLHSAAGQEDTLQDQEEEGRNMEAAKGNLEARSDTSKEDTKAASSRTSGSPADGSPDNETAKENTTKEGFMIAIDTSKTSIVDSLVEAEASFVPGRWERCFRRLGEEEGSMGL